MRSAKVTTLRFKTFTANEILIGELRNKIFASGLTYQQIAIVADVASSTVGNLARGKTIWPRPKTLFGVLHSIGYTLQIVKEYGNEKEAS